MDYWSLIYILPAVFSLAVIIANALPFDRTSRHNTLLIFLAGIAVLNLPLHVQIALALCLPVAYLHKFFNISLSDIGKADYKIRLVMPAVKRFKAQVTPTKVRGFLTRAYPNPDTAEPEEEEPEIEPTTLTKVRRFVPEL
jgi:hypothetical protein